MKKFESMETEEVKNRLAKISEKGLKFVSLSVVEMLIKRFNYDLKEFFHFLETTTRFPAESFKDAMKILREEWQYEKNQLRDSSIFSSLFLIILKKNKKFLQKFEKKYGEVYK